MHRRTSFLRSLARRTSLFCLFVCLVCVAPPVSAREQLRVGIYDLPPFTSINSSGKPQGLFVEVLNEIARQEGWEITYVLTDMNQSFGQLERGELQLVAPVIRTEERTKSLDFPEQAVHLDWGEVIMPPGQKIETLLDLQGKEIAVVRGSILAQALIDQLEQFHISARLIEVDDYQQLFNAVSKGRYASGIGASLPIRYFNQYAPITRTPIIFSPVHLTFAAARDRQPQLIAAINAHLTRLKADPASVYFKIQNKWLPDYEQAQLRKYTVGGGILFAAALFLGGLSFFLYRKVRKKIAELLSVNQQLLDNREELRRTNQQFQILLDGIPNDLMLISPEMRVLWMNRSAKLQVKNRDDHAPVRSCYCEWADSSSPCMGCPVQACFKSGTAQETLIHRGEQTFGVKAFPLHNADGAVESVIKIAVDISDKIRLREENDRQNRLSAVGTLATGVAHEINNPVGLILSNLEIISEAYEDAAPILAEHYRNAGDFSFGGLTFSYMHDKVPVLLRETSDAACRIRQTVEDLKDFSRGERHDARDLFPLEDAIVRSLRLTDHLLRKATDQFHLQLTQEAIMLQGQQRRIEQVLVNLLANASQSLLDRNRAITLSTRFDTSRQIVAIVVQDEGRGIAAEHLPKLATPFFTTRQREGGTGLGLSVSFGIIKEHGGNIHFASEPGRGTTVTVTLPAGLAEVTP